MKNVKAWAVWDKQIGFIMAHKEKKVCKGYARIPFTSDWKVIPVWITPIKRRGKRG